MANTYTQIHFQLVFVVKNRHRLLHPQWRKELFAYMGQIINNKGHKTLIVNGVEDHVHVLLGYNPKQALSELVRDVKRSAALFISEKGWANGNFAWQEGFAAFSYSKSQVDLVYIYIERQEEKHQRRTFREEYLDMLRRNEVKYDERYLFEFFD